MPTVNEDLRDAMVRHQVNLQRYSAGVVKKIVELLNDVEEDLVAQITRRLRSVQGLDSPKDVERLEQLLEGITDLRESAVTGASKALQGELESLALAEPRLFAHQLETVRPVILDLAMPAAEKLKQLVKSQPFQGRTLKQWAQSLLSSDLARIDNEIRLGIAAGEDSATIARRIVGSARLKGTDGITQITRQNAEAISRTAINFISNAARREFILANKDLIDEEVYVATLDSRTTPVCRSLDGNRYAVGKGPVPPLHFGCRSTRIPVLNGKVLGNRPFKASTEEQLLREFAQANNLDKVPSSRDALPFGLKGKFDDFGAARVREMTGRVPAVTTYQEWLETQPKWFQDDVLGPTRAKLFRDGKLTLDKFVNRAGDELNLSELARNQAEAFRAAGLDPGDFT